MLLLLLERGFSACHRIRILGELEPWHGHEFRCRVEVACADERDAGTLEPALADVLAGLERTRMEEVERGGRGHASAERIAAWIHGRLASRLAEDPALRVESVRITEAAGCAATYRV
jgi:6-pyruvoyl-tetrahydropterin synthase